MRRVGWTAFAEFLKCPQAHAWHRTKPEPPNAVIAERRERGRLVHAVLHQFYLREFWRDAKPLDRMLSVLQEAARETPPGCLGQVVEVTELLPGILETIKREHLVGVLNRTECPVSLIVRGVSVEGRADLLVRGLDGKVRLLDGKGSQVDRDQLRFYALALEHTVPWYFPHYIGTWHYRKHVVSWMKFTPAQQVKFRQKLDDGMEYYLSALPDDAPAKVGSHCRWCPYTVACEPYRQRIRDKQAAAPDVPAGGGFVSLE